MEFEIYWDDLNPYAQERLLEAAGIEEPEEMNWDVLPITTVVLPEEEEENWDKEEDNYDED